MNDTNTEIWTCIQTRSLPLSRNWESTKGQFLHWKQPKRFQKKFQLHAQEYIWGTLTFENNQFIPRAAAKTADQEWAFKYTRFSLPKVTIQKKNELVAQAIIETNWGWHGSLVFDDGGDISGNLQSTPRKNFVF